MHVQPDHEKPVATGSDTEIEKPKASGEKENTDNQNEDFLQNEDLRSMRTVTDDLLHQAIQSQKTQNLIRIIGEIYSEPIKTIIRQLPLKAAWVSYPEVQETKLQNYMIYKVTFVWKNREFVVFRRFSDFKMLRAAIRSLLPFTLIYPMHGGRLIVV
jgi:hypothetical protein